MSRHAPLVRDLADRLRRLEISSLIYFHTDHFEPWREVGEAVPAVGAEIVDSIHDFRRATERLDFARRLTLFYKPHLNYALRRDGDLVRADPEDLVGFLPRSDAEERFGRAAMYGLTAFSKHEIQLHIHHEYYTATKAHTDPAAVEWFASPLGRQLDDGRLELAIRLNREIIARETGRVSERWFFAHGHWALNASDDSSCAITNEIDILLRNGCRGDFTFPAGRPHVNPRIKVPYFCRAVNEPKGYDRPEAEPEIAYGNGAAASTKFFIWSSAATSQQCSLDYMSEGSRRHLENTAKAAGELIDGSYLAGHRLFIKTHAHSMHPYYFEHTCSAVFPHQYPATQTLLSVIFEAAAHAGIEVQFLTAGEVYDAVTAADTQPEINLVAAYLRGISPFRSSTPVARQAREQRPEAAAAGVAAPAPFGPAAAVELVRETGARVLGQRIERLGTRGSGAYDHYSTMLRRGFPIPDYELAALDIIRQHVPRLHAYHEIGSGIGTLPFLLAINGFQSVGIERDKRRHETARAIWRELATKPGVAKGACRLLLGSFPDVVAWRDVSQSIAVITDFITTQTPEQLQSIVDGLRRYRFVLLDLQRFCVSRETREAQLSLLDEFRAKGFSATLEITDPKGSDYAFALFHNEAAAERRGTKAGWSRLIRAWRSTGVSRH